MSRFSKPQILAILRQAEGGIPVPDLCREYGMSTASFYKWRGKYGGMDASMISQTKALEDEKEASRSWSSNLKKDWHWQSSIALPPAAKSTSESLRWKSSSGPITLKVSNYFHADGLSSAHLHGWDGVVAG
jgi:hypothetical protein